MNKIRLWTIIAGCFLLTACYVQEPVRVTWIDPDKEQKEAISFLAEQISIKLAQANCRNVAILPFFDLNKRVTELGRSIAIDLQGAVLRFGDRKFAVVERDLFGETAEKELAFGSKKNWINPATLLKFKRVYGADFLVVGWVTDTGNRFKISARILETERGSALTEVESFLSRTPHRERQNRNYVW